MTDRFVYNSAGDLTDLCDRNQIGDVNRSQGFGAPGGGVTNLYDSLGRLTLTAWKNTSGTVLNAHGYEIDAAQQRTRQMRTNSAASHSHTLGYQYDGMGQVTHARATNNATGLPVTGELLGLTYDAAWNMTARTNGGTVNYGVNNLNQVTGDGGTYTYTYDNNGNRTYRTPSGGGYVLMVYDDENQLIRQETDTSTTWESYRFKLEYVYDGKLRLRERKYYTWLSGSWYPTSTERYVYDGMLLVQERPSSPSVCYTRGVDLSGSLDGAGGIGGLLARSHGFNTGTGAWSTHSAYHADGNGNVTALLSTSTGSQAAWYRYDAFGRQLQSSGTLSGANRMRFSSKPWMAPAVDDSAGMYYYGYRFYDPLTQRWANRDPLGDAELLPDGPNLHVFARNKPISYYDPDGAQSSVAHPGGVAIALEAEAAAMGFASYAAMQAALREAARRAALYGGAALALSQSQCKPKNDDPCKRFNNLRSYITQNHRDVLTQVSNVIKANGTQADLNTIMGLTPELQAMMAAMYQAAADCYGGRRDNSFNEERAKFLRGERSTGPGSNLRK